MADRGRRAFPVSSAIVDEVRTISSLFSVLLCQSYLGLGVHRNAQGLECGWPAHQRRVACKSMRGTVRFAVHQDKRLPLARPCGLYLLCLLQKQWDHSFKVHRHRVHTMKPAITTAAPADYVHFHYNAKRAMQQAERLFDIERVCLIIMHSSGLAHAE
jgi:hypothetical protein